MRKRVFSAHADSDDPDQPEYSDHVAVAVSSQETMVNKMLDQTVYKVNVKKRKFSGLMLYNITKTSLFKYTENFTTKKGKFSDKNKSDIFHVSAQNIDCGYSLEPPHRGGSNEYPQSMFLSRNKKNNVYPCKPQFHCIKVGFKGVKTI